MSQAYPQLQLFINGQWLSADGRKSEPVINPLDESTLGQLPHASPADLQAALQAANAAFEGWKRTSPLARSDILRKAASLIRERAGHIARCMTLEQGKPVREARLEVLAAADTYDWYAEEGRRNYGRLVPGKTPTQRIAVHHEPVGVCAAFAPWNFPAITPARKIAGALAAGCTLVLKPAEETPATAQELVRVLHDAGLPAGVLNMVFGVPAEVSGYLLDQPEVAKFSFTGSTAVGKMLASHAAKSMKRATLELGGHAPVIVWKDADIEKAADALVAGKFRNAGQVCISPTRFYVHRDVFDRFVTAFVERTRKLKVGNGLDESSQMGPLANPRRIEALTRLIADAQDKGATLHTGGKRMPGKGFFWEPTVISNLPEDAGLMNEEPFGPVALINPIADMDEALQRANRLQYGLAAYAFTQDSAVRQQLSNGVQTGMLGINTLNISMAEAPFGGVKESGWGSECGIEGLQAYCNIKLVSEDQ
ncbi:NAD-dependent succinate-semialdehyde dehydrogenase [Comamonas sediminis]|uniref:NAD-dependent succinate-semialdehyde dehydrogenase n=1 Tax=Comamonas sediminis TaxID=1783360 RepID=UPI003D2925E7